MYILTSDIIFSRQVIGEYYLVMFFFEGII